MSDDSDEYLSVLRQQFVHELFNQGFLLSSSDGFAITQLESTNKDTIRMLHSSARNEVLKSNSLFIEKNMSYFYQMIADWRDININKFQPEVVEVKSRSVEATLFRMCTMLWSIPVSYGYGRRKRFLVKDMHNNKIVGIFALGDPVFNLAARDRHIGWNAVTRAERLYNVMDLFVLGAVFPYSQLLCGKLLAMLATTNYIRKIIEDYYENTWLSGENF